MRFECGPYWHCVSMVPALTQCQCTLIFLHFFERILNFLWSSGPKYILIILINNYLLHFFKVQTWPLNIMRPWSKSMSLAWRWGMTILLLLMMPGTILTVGFFVRTCGWSWRTGSSTLIISTTRIHWNDINKNDN